MDSSLKSLINDGLTDAVKAWDHRLVVTISPGQTIELRGVRSDIQELDETIQVGGFEVKRVFTIRFKDPATADLIKIGKATATVAGMSWRVIAKRADEFGGHITFGSSNR